MSETRILLLRHAETSAPDRFHGAESDVGLGPRGRDQAEAVARVLAHEHPRAVYSSAMRRAVDTAVPIARACGVEPEVVPELHERRMGPLSGVARDEGFAAYDEAKQRWMAGETSYTHPGGESFDDIERRVLPIFLGLAERWRGETLVVVAHGVVIRVLLIRLLEGSGPEHFGQFSIDNTALNDLRWDGTTWTAACLNRRVVPGLEGFAW